MAGIENWTPDNTFQIHKSTGILDDIGNAFKGVGNMFADPVIGIGKHGYGVVAGGEGGRGAQAKKLLGSVGLTGLTFVPGGRAVSAAARSGTNLTRAQINSLRALEQASKGPRAFYNPMRLLRGNRDAASQLAARQKLYNSGELNFLKNIPMGPGNAYPGVFTGNQGFLRSGLQNFGNSFRVTNPNWWRGMTSRAALPWHATGATISGLASAGMGRMTPEDQLPGTNLWDLLNSLGGEGDSYGAGKNSWDSWLPTAKSDEKF